MNKARKPVHLNWGAAKDWNKVRTRLHEVFPRTTLFGNFADIYDRGVTPVSRQLKRAGFSVQRQPTSYETHYYDLRIKLAETDDVAQAA